MCGDRRGHRRAVVTRVNVGKLVEFSIVVGTEEVIPRDMMLKWVADRISNLSRFEIQRGASCAPNR